MLLDSAHNIFCSLHRISIESECILNSSNSDLFASMRRTFVARANQIAFGNCLNKNREREKHIHILARRLDTHKHVTGTGRRSQCAFRVWHRKYWHFAAIRKAHTHNLPSKMVIVTPAINAFRMMQWTVHMWALTSNNWWINRWIMQRQRKT